MTDIQPKIIVISLRFILASIVILVGAGIFWNIKNDVARKEKDALFMVDQRLSSLFFEINNFPRGPGQDVVFLSQLGSLKNYVSGHPDDQEAYKQIAKDFSAYLDQSDAYYSVRYVDLEKTEHDVYIPRGAGDKTGVKHFFNDENHNLKDYESIGGGLKEGAVYISPLHRHQENGKLITALFYITPVFDGTGARRGAVILTIDADYFLDDIRNYAKPDEAVYLIDNKGFYLAHPDSEKEFLADQNGLGTFVNDYPDIGEKILSSRERRLEDDEYVFSLRHIEPTASSFELHEGEQLSKDGDYYWILVSAYKKQTAKSPLSSFFSCDFIVGHLAMFGFVLVLSATGIFITKFFHNASR